MAVLSHEGTYSILYGSWPIPVGTAHRTGYIARPDESGRFPVVVVVPTLDGLGSLEKEVCRRLARHGLVGVSMGFYSPNDSAIEAYNDLDDSDALRALDELYEFLSSDDVTWMAGDVVGMLGLDVGGRFALIKSATREWAAALAICATPLTGDEERGMPVAGYLEHLPVPVLGLYGADDDLIDAATVDEAQRRNDHGQWLLYEGAGHGFLDPYGPAFHQSAADDAVARVVAFFKTTLPEAEVEDLG